MMVINVVFASSQTLLQWLFCLRFVSHSDASAEATHIISAISEVPSVPAPCDTEGAAAKGSCCLICRSGWTPSTPQGCQACSLTHSFVISSVVPCVFCTLFCPVECKDCESHVEGHASEEAPVVKEALKERPAEEVTAILAQQEKEETDVLTCGLQTNSTRYLRSHEASNLGVNIVI